MEKEKVDEIITKWDNLLVFDEYKYIINKKNAALSCELTAIHLIEDKDYNKYDFIIDNISFPVIVKIFGKIEQDVEIDTMAKNVLLIIKKLNFEYIEFEKISETKILKNFLTDFSENYQLI